MSTPMSRAEDDRDDEMGGARGMNDRLVRLERELTRMGDEVRASRRALHTTRRGLRLACTLGMAVIIAGVMVGTASAGPGPQPLTVKEPFRVVDGSGALRLDVSGGAVRFYHGGQVVAAMGGNSNGGVLYTTDAAGRATTGLATDSGGNGVLNIGQVGGAHTIMGVKNGKMALRVYKGSTMVAALGESAWGGRLELNDATGKATVFAGGNAFGGLVQVNDTTGNPRVFAGATAGGKGYLEIQNAGGQAVVQLKESGASGGYIGLSNAGGTARVEAGVVGGDKGVVRAFGPGGFDFILGRG